MVSSFFQKLIFYCLAIQSITCFITSESIGFTLPLIPRFSPESPFYPGNLMFEEKVDNAMELSMSRAYHIDSMSSQGSTSSNNIHLTVRAQGPYFYTTEIAIGTPNYTQSLIFDTGSDLLWTQCEPCVNCFNQSIPIFAPNKSSSYSTVPCNDPICRGYKCVNGKCRYKLSYDGGTVAEGFVSRETFTFESNKGHHNRVSDIVFGCGDDNKGFRFSPYKISGIVGLNIGRDSLISQLFHLIKGRFSYCLVYSDGEVTGKSSFRFGEDAIIKTRHGVQTINFVKSGGNYFVTLIDVTVGNKRMRFPPGTFELKSGGSKGGCAFDTGTSVTFFPQGPYDVVMKEFDKHFKSHHLERAYNISKEFNYCYKYKSKSEPLRAYASMTLHFQNADYVVVPQYQYIHFRARGGFCVAVVVFPGQSQRTLIGSWQQQDMRFLYDLQKEQIQFVRETCAHDQ